MNLNLSEEEKQAVKTALERWGVEDQVNMVVEECAELLVALNHYRRGRTKDLHEVAGEVADVILMMSQLSHIVDQISEEPLVQKRLDEKTKRFLERVKK